MCNIHMTQQSIHVFYSITLVYFGILPILLFLQNMRSFSFHCLKVNSVHFNFSEWNGQTFIASLRMWDVDDSGSINVTEMTNIIATMDDVEGEEQDPKVICHIANVFFINLMSPSSLARATFLKTECKDESQGDIWQTWCWWWWWDHQNWVCWRVFNADEIKIKLFVINL